MRTSHSVLTACVVLSVCLLAPRLLAQESESNGCPTAISKDAGKPAPETDANGMSSDSVVIVTELGDIRFRFFPKDAPCTVARMRELIASGFYDGLTFHRVVPGFVVQGGDPVGNGTGGSGQRIRPEFNQRHHTEGTVAMSRTSDPNSADSQFYFSLGTFPHLDGNYTVFGQVVEGMDVVRKIRVGDVMRKVVIEKK
jgi:cyclophilin family peptidyl-prolyl cis-trans isomerase